MDTERRRYWQELIQEQKKSGTTIVEFCRQKQINKANFYTWAHRLKQTSMEETKINATNPQQCFVPLVLEDTPSTSLIVRKMGFEIVLTNNTNKALLIDVLSVLSTL